MKAFQLRYGNLDLKFEKCEFMYAAVKVRPGYIFIHIWCTAENGIHCSCVTEEPLWDAVGVLAGVHAFSVGGGKECIWDR